MRDRGVAATSPKPRERAAGCDAICEIARDSDSLAGYYATLRNDDSTDERCLQASTARGTACETSELREKLRDAPWHSTHVHYTRNAAPPQRLSEGVSVMRRVPYCPQLRRGDGSLSRHRRRVGMRGEAASVNE